jgi:hypothetical protein
MLAFCPRSFSIVGERCSKIYSRALREGASMLGVEDLVGYSSLRDSSSHCLFETLSDAREQCYWSLGSG